MGSVRRLTKKIDKVISEIQKRNKLIRLADRSAGGWRIVQEYMPDELVSDSDDSRKMRQVGNRATKKRKLVFPRKSSSTFSSATQGRLKTHLDYWGNVLGANGVVTSVIKKGYKITFTYTLQKACFENNKSALRNSDFVTDSIKDLLVNKLVKETNNIPHVVSPLSVAENFADKKRQILDLRYVNKHIYTHKVKFDDWKCFQNFLKVGSKFMFKFDLKSVYHHIDINETYLGFSWKIDGKVRHFVFTVRTQFSLVSDCPSLEKIQTQSSYKDSMFLGRWSERSRVLL